MHRWSDTAAAAMPGSNMPFDFRSGEPVSAFRSPCTIQCMRACVHEDASPGIRHPARHCGRLCWRSHLVSATHWASLKVMAVSHRVGLCATIWQCTLRFPGRRPCLTSFSTLGHIMACILLSGLVLSGGSLDMNHCLAWLGHLAPNADTPCLAPFALHVGAHTHCN
jgi:hypothetical protein